MTYRSKPSEQEGEDLVQHLNVEPELPQECMRRGIDVVKLGYAMNSSKECAVEPAATLGDQFWDLNELSGPIMHVPMSYCEPRWGHR